MFIGITLSYEVHSGNALHIELVLYVLHLVLRLPAITVIVNLLIFAAFNLSVLPMECQFTGINFEVYLACLMSFNVRKYKIFAAIYFTKISASRMAKNRS